jgi:hypothetical protein
MTESDAETKKADRHIFERLITSVSSIKERKKWAEENPDFVRPAVIIQVPNFL